MSDHQDGDLIRDCKAAHEENVLNGWLREYVEGKAEEREKVSRAAKEEESNSGKERWREEGRWSRLTANEFVLMAL